MTLPLIIAGGVLLAASLPAAAYDVAEKSMVQIKTDLAAGRVTSLELVRLYRTRIAALNPTLHAVIALNPLAAQQAQAADAVRREGRPQGVLAGVPILIKDNIESADPMPTTAGSLALAKNMPGQDAALVARLRASGAVLLAKTNLSEWANIRSTPSISGWSAVGGQARVLVPMLNDEVALVSQPLWHSYPSRNGWLSCRPAQPLKPKRT